MMSTPYWSSPMAKLMSCVGAFVADMAAAATAGLNCMGSVADETAESIMIRIALVLVISTRTGIVSDLRHLR